jgi:hypothetical protein
MMNIERDSVVERQVDDWLEDCYNPDAALSSTEKLTQAYRLLMQFKLRLEDGKFHPCKNCDGTGTINRNSLGDPQFDQFCPECNGDGLTE